MFTLLHSLNHRCSDSLALPTPHCRMVPLLRGGPATRPGPALVGSLLLPTVTQIWKLSRRPRALPRIHSPRGILRPGCIPHPVHQNGEEWGGLCPSAVPQTAFELTEKTNLGIM